MEITVTIHQEGGSFWSEVEELPGCFAAGRTLAELRAALAEAAGMYLWDLPGELRGDVLPTGQSRVQIVPEPWR